MITLKSCPNCKSNSIVQYRQVIQPPDVAYEIMPGVKVNATVISRYYICQNCNLIFQNPRLSDTDLDRFYSQGYYRRTIDATKEEMNFDEESRAKVDVAIVKKIIGDVESHLDIGSGRGYLLEGIGANIKVGVDANIDYIKAKSVSIYSDINQVPQKQFDLVTAIHVLEHVSKPLDYLKKMTNLVKKGGYLVIEVPTWKSPGGSLRFAHLYHFEPDVLKLMCAQVGLTVEHTEFTPHLLLICKHDK
jgi:SAM-dependent methyltransferase